MIDSTHSPEHSPEQSDLDQLIRSNEPLPDSGNAYIPLYQALQSSSVSLPSNFPFRVMRKILEVKLDNAKANASFQSAIIAIFALLVSAFLFLHYGAGTGALLAPLLALAMTLKLAFPLLAAVTLIALILLDRLLQSGSHSR